MHCLYKLYYQTTSYCNRYNFLSDYYKNQLIIMHNNLLLINNVKFFDTVNS